MKQKLSEINILRGMACILVVLIHTSSNGIYSMKPMSLQSFLFDVINKSATCAVPIFIFLSGFSLYYNYQEKINIPKFLAKRILSTLVPFFIWSFVYFEYYYDKHIYDHDWAFFWKSVWEANISFHLYFFVIIVQFYLLFPILRIYFNKFKPLLVLGSLFLISLYSVKFPWMKENVKFFPQYLFYFGLGCQVAVWKKADWKEPTWVKPVVLSVFPVFAAVLSFLYFRSEFYEPLKFFPGINVLWMLYSIIAILALYILSGYVAKLHFIIAKPLEWLGDASLYVYLAHPLALYIVGLLFKKYNYMSVTGQFLLSTVFVFATVVPLSILYVKSKEWYTAAPKRVASKQVNS